MRCQTFLIILLLALQPVSGSATVWSPDVSHPGVSFDAPDHDHCAGGDLEAGHDAMGHEGETCGQDCPDCGSCSGIVSLPAGDRSGLLLPYPAIPALAGVLAERNRDAIYRPPITL